MSEEIAVPFKILVDECVIEYNQNNYNFETNRCEFIKSTLERAAIGMAIGCTVRNKVLDKLEKDYSGTDYEIEIQYCYGAAKPFLKDQPIERAGAVLKYKAQNGNYKQASLWK